jgi:DNA (cytosine-5)-methyltransferase 1
MSKKQLRSAGVCSGIGGFDKGFEDNGIETVWQSEIEPNAAAVLRHRFKGVPNYGDMRLIYNGDGRTIEPIDILHGGTPCQDLSVAGKRKGLDGERSGLFFHFIRIAKRIRAHGGGRIVVWENVPGAFSSNDGRDYACVLRAFTGVTVEVPVDGWGNAGFVATPFSCRWNVAWRVLDSQYFGVPQRRRRIFLVASAGDASCIEILFEPEGLFRDPPARRTQGQGDSADAEGGSVYCLQGNTIGRSDSAGAAGAGVNKDVSFTLNTIDRHAVAGTICKESFTGGAGGRPEGAAANHFVPDVSPAITSKWAKGSAGPAGDECQNLVVACHDAAGTLDLKSCSANRGSQTNEAEFIVAVHQNGAGELQRVAERDVSPSLTTENMAIAGAVGVRRLTPLECERLQGFPDGWTAVGLDHDVYPKKPKRLKKSVERSQQRGLTHEDRVRRMTDSARYRMLGNAVTVNVTRWLGTRIVQILLSN